MGLKETAGLLLFLLQLLASFKLGQAAESEATAAPSDECQEPCTRGVTYYGLTNTTVTGRACQQWSSTYPHRPGQPEWASLGHHNLCRNPSNSEGGVWCYTTDPGIRWEFCPVPFCGKVALEKARNIDSTVILNTHLESETDFSEDNSPSSEDTIEDTSEDGNEDIREDISKDNSEDTNDECQDGSNRGVTYYGLTNTTRKGRSCQQWSSSSPHKPGQPEWASLGHHNHCRNPSNSEGGVWCYTTDPGIRWEFCPVPFCGANGVSRQASSNSSSCQTMDGSPCVFPFKDNYKLSFSGCKWFQKEKYFWCATGLDGEGKYRTHGKCDMDTCQAQEKGRCSAATSQISPLKHLYARDGMQVSRIAFSSCYKPERVANKGSTFWSSVRRGGAELWLWLGDNVYADGTDMNYKRSKYNQAREEASYVAEGPLKAGGELPVMATWDDHDLTSNTGSNYPCLMEAQEEFVRHFNIGPDSPLHWAGGRQEGVYNARTFLQPGGRQVGLQVIMLDARTGRDPTYSKHGECRGAESKMLSDSQWTWLEERLLLQSEVTVIGSGIQVLPPTSRTRGKCSEDGQESSSTFQEAIRRLGEEEAEGTVYESWAEMPQERARLLGLVQKTLATGRTGAVVFVSGDQHWGELMAKRMPESEQFGASQVLYEVTASGIYQKWPQNVVNTNRLFSAPELVQQWASNSSRGCDGGQARICRAEANYGFIEVDFRARRISMGVRTPEEGEQSEHVIHY